VTEKELDKDSIAVR